VGNKELLGKYSKRDPEFFRRSDGTGNFILGSLEGEANPAREPEARKPEALRCHVLNCQRSMYRNWIAMFCFWRICP
jgi:hypothetical protein